MSDYAKRLLYLKLAVPIGIAFLVVLGLILMMTLMAQQESSSGDATWSELALTEIAPSTRLAYERAAEAYDLDGPYTLAGLMWVETQHGTSKLPGVTSGVNEYGCCAGPAQFMVSRNAGCRTSCYADPSKGTWEAYGVDGDGDGKLNVYDIDDAAMSAANYLHANGAPKDWKKALMVYNQSTAYGLEVMERGQMYRAVGGGGDLAIAGGLSRGQVANHPNLSFTSPCARADMLTSDERLVVMIGSILQAGHTLKITAMACDHSPGTNHEAGRAADIGSVDGKVCNPYGPTDACGKLAISISQVKGKYHVSELIAGFDPNTADGGSWAQSDHQDHIHLGFKAG